jgi:glyoxylase-like metal-dependent hydrolase (beta-lactamase superfamily II)
VIVARREWNDAQGIRGKLRGYLPQRWPAGLVTRIIDFDGPAIGPFPGSYDVASDGQLLVVPLPGHTRGHAGLLVRVGPSRSYLCAGDAATRAQDMASMAPAIADWCQQSNTVILTTHDDAVRF